MRPIVIIGGSGFVGRALTAALLAEGYAVRIVGRSLSRLQAQYESGVDLVEWDGRDSLTLAPVLSDCHGVINLAGENVGQPPWTTAKCNRIRESRIQGTTAVTEAICGLSNPPTVLIQASAIGFYGHREDEELTEVSDSGAGFLAEVCREWENASAGLPETTRRVQIRIGIVLGRGGGMLGSVLPLFKLFAGGHPGSGRQWMSWIHLADLVAAILHLLRNSSITGPVNLVSPNPLRARDFYRILGLTIRRPSWLHPPAFVMKLLLWGMAEDLLLASTRVEPDILMQSGFAWRFPDLEKALSDLLDV